MPSLNWPAAMGGWTIDSVTMAGPGWRPDSLEVLWGPPSNRGQDRIVPGVGGQRAQGRYIDARTVDVPMLITGSVDQAGSAHSDPTEGLVANLDAIWAGVVTPPALPDKTRTSTITMPDASTRVAEIVVERMSELVRESGNLARMVLTITIPGGAHYAP